MEDWRAEAESLLYGRGLLGLRILGCCSRRLAFSKRSVKRGEMNILLANLYRLAGPQIIECSKVFCRSEKADCHWKQRGKILKTFGECFFPKF